jgi:hypothetical protein
VLVIKAEDAFLVVESQLGQAQLLLSDSDHLFYLLLRFPAIGLPQGLDSLVGNVKQHCVHMETGLFFVHHFSYLVSVFAAQTLSALGNLPTA